MTADDAWTRARWDESLGESRFMEGAVVGGGRLRYVNTWSLQASIVVQTKWPVNG